MVLKILILELVLKSDDRQTFFSCWKAAIALPMQALTSISFCSPVLSTVLPRYVNLSTSSNASPSNIMGVPVAGLTFSTLLFPYGSLGPNVLRRLPQRWSFPASDVESVKERPGRQHSPGHLTASKVSNGYHFVLGL